MTRRTLLSDAGHTSQVIRRPSNDKTYRTGELRKFPGRELGQLRKDLVGIFRSAPTPQKYRKEDRLLLWPAAASRSLRPWSGFSTSGLYTIDAMITAQFCVARSSRCDRHHSQLEARLVEWSAGKEEQTWRQINFIGTKATRQFLAAARIRSARFNQHRAARHTSF